MQIWTPIQQPRDDGEFPVHIIGLSGDSLTALTMETPGDCDRLINAAILAKSLLLGETSGAGDGDDPLPPYHGTNGTGQCTAEEPPGGGYICTAQPGHAGPLHVAYGTGSEILHSWRVDDRTGTDAS